MSFTQAEVFITNTQKYLLKSIYVNDEFSINVALPNGYYETEKKYPVLYLLDSNIFFGLVADTARLLQFGKEIPELIIVGIGYPDDDKHMVLRNRDYLPTYNEVSPMSGKADKFLEFIEEELIPFISERYRADETDAALAGDSYSGLFALYTLFNRPQLFNRYIIGSPSIYWDDRVIFDYEEKYYEENKALRAKVFLSAGELEAVYEPEFARMVGNVVDLGSVLKSRNYSGLELKMHVFEAETHLSVIPATMSRGLRYVFSK